MTSPLVGRSAAVQKMTHHQFVKGLGYIAHSGPPELPAHLAGKKNCAPPAGTQNDSHHMLRPPNGAPDMVMRWIAGEQAWASLIPEKGNRLAWPVQHLQRAGWEYVGPEGTAAPATQSAPSAQNAQPGPKLNIQNRRKNTRR